MVMAMVINTGIMMLKNNQVLVIVVMMMSMLLFLLMMTMMMMMTTVTIIAKRSFIMIGKDQSCSVYTFITIMYRFLLASLILIRFFLPPTFSVSTRYFPSRKPWLSKSRPAAQERPFLWSQNGALHIAYLHGFIYVYTPMSLYVQRSQIYLLYTVYIYIYIYHSTFILIYAISYQYYIIYIYIEHKSMICDQLTSWLTSLSLVAVTSPKPPKIRVSSTG